MGFEAEFNWVLVVKKRYWEGIAKYLVDNPDQQHVQFEVKKEGSRLYPVGHKVFLCEGDALHPVAIVKICSANPYLLSDGKTLKTSVKFQVSYQLSRSRQMNLSEVFRHLV